MGLGHEEGRDDEPELIVAVELDDLEQVDALLRSGADPEATNQHGVPGLAVAAIWGRVKVLRRLLAAGADPTRTFGSDRMTALMVAKNPSCARYLLEAGADINARTSDGVNVIAAAVHDNQRTKAFKRVLLEAGADPTVENAVSHLCALDSPSTVDRSLFVEFGYDPDERPAPRLETGVLLAAVREEAARLGWEVPDDLVLADESRYTVAYELRPEDSGGWTDDEHARWENADEEERERIGTAVRDRRQRRVVRVDVRTAAVTSHW